MSLTRQEIERLKKLQEIIASMIKDVAEHFDCFNSPLPLNIMAIKYNKRITRIEMSFCNVIEMLIQDKTFEVMRKRSGGRFILPKNTTWQWPDYKLASQAINESNDSKGKVSDIGTFKAKESSESNEGRTKSADTIATKSQKTFSKIGRVSSKGA